MARPSLELLFRNAEVARFSACMLPKFAEISAKYTKSALRDDMIRELKALRSKTELKEQKLLPKVYLQACLGVVWGN